MRSPIKILVVDDDDRERLLLKTLLTRMGDGYEVVAARNGCEALEMAKHTVFNVLLTDLRMPKMGGVALTKAFVKLYPQTIVIWITAYGPHLHKAVKQLPVYRCLDKPVEIDEIRQTVLDALHHGGML